MGISTTTRRLLRYFSNPKYLFSLSLSSSTETLNPSFTPPYSLFFQSHQFHTKPSSRSPFSLISSSGSPSFSCLASLFSQSSGSLCINGVLRPHCLYCSLSDVTPSSSLVTMIPDKISEVDNKLTSGQTSEIVELIRSGDDDMESKLNLRGLSLSVESLIGIFRVLNSERVSALRFFEWAQSKNGNLLYNSKLCSLIFENCGWLGDYETMFTLLKDFRSKKICLTDDAFRFLPVLGPSKDLNLESIKKIIGVLNEVGGSCCGSGIVVLIKTLCSLGSFEIAKFVIEITERKVSYYNILVRERCRRCQFEEVRALFEEMRRFGCGPNAKTYNYLLSSLCKNNRTDEASAILEEMEENDCSPDALTYEILIYFSCRQGKLEFATQFLDQMVSRGLEPRLTTHTAFIKGFFDSKLYEESYKYVVDSGNRYKFSSNMIYSLLASLHQKKGDLVIARNILIEMMEKDLKPYFPVYLRVVKRLRRSGKGHLARDLQNRFSRFRVEPASTQT